MERGDLCLTWDLALKHPDVSLCWSVRLTYNKSSYIIQASFFEGFCSLADPQDILKPLHLKRGWRHGHCFSILWTIFTSIMEEKFRRDASHESVRVSRAVGHPAWWLCVHCPGSPRAVCAGPWRGNGWLPGTHWGVSGMARGWIWGMSAGLPWS